MKSMQTSRRMAAVLIVGVGVFQPVKALAQKLLDEGIKDLSAQIASSVSKEQKRKIAVIPFRELDGRATVLGAYLAEELTTNLFNVGNLEIVERGMLDKVMTELKLSQSGLIDPSTAKQVGKVVGVDAIVTGTITDLQSYVALNCRLIDTQTGRIFGAAQAKIVKDDNLRKVMGSLMPGSEAREGSRSDEPAESSLGSGSLPKEQQGAKAPVKFAETESYRLAVDSLKKAHGMITLVVTLEAILNRPVEVNLSWEPYLLDDRGERWDLDKQQTVEVDPASYRPKGGAASWGMRAVAGKNVLLGQVDLVPGTKVRSTGVFEPKGGTAGTVFTLVLKEATRGSGSRYGRTISLPNLRVQAK